MSKKRKTTTGLLFITYNINSLGPEEYMDFQKAIQEYPHRKISDSCYMIKTKLSPETIYDELRTHLSKRDTLIICPFTRPWYGRSAANLIIGLLRTMNHTSVR